MSAGEAAEAMAAGWRAGRPADELVLLPLSDGGPGFVSCLLSGFGVRSEGRAGDRSEGRAGDRSEGRAGDRSEGPADDEDEVVGVPGVEDPLGRPTSGTLALRDGTAYVESAQACGLHLLTEADRDPGRTTTYGVGQLIRGAVEAGARRVVVGLGGSGTNDGGAGMLAALGLAGLDAAGRLLTPGGLALTGAATLSHRHPLVRRDGALRLVGPAAEPVELVAATDVDAPLLGPTGASVVFGPQKGASPGQVVALDAALANWADVLAGHLGLDVRDLPGAGAAGGLGFALLALGARRVPGLDVVAEEVGLDTAVAAADLVVTGEGSFDASSLHGKVVSGVAARAMAAGVPCVALAGQVSVGRREAAAAGIEASYSLAEAVGLERALADPVGSLVTVAARVAREWSR